MNKKIIILLSLLVIAAITIAFKYFSMPQSTEPWTEDQLMPPAKLADILDKGEAENIFIYSIGPAGSIKNSIEIGEGRDESNIEKLRAEVSKLPKDAEIVIYCGCCPFKNCPNIRPAFTLLNEMEFTDHRLLNLTKNLKADWIDKGYPVKELEAED